MKLVCLGGAGAMASSFLYDLHKTSDFDEIVLADFDERKAKRILDLMDGDKRFSFTRLDATKKEEIAEVLKGADCVYDGLPDQFVFNFMDVASEIGINGVTLSTIGMTDARLEKYSNALKEKGKTVLLNSGGGTITSVMDILGCEELDEVEEINEYWSLWRPITQATPGLIYAAIQFDPRSSDRVYWENGEYVRNLRPFALPKDWEFPEPIGKQETHIIEHGEPMPPFIPSIRKKGLKRVICRGVFHYGWTRLGRVLLENGIFEAEPIEVNGVKVSPYEVIMKHIERHAAEKWEDSYTIAKKLGFKPQDIMSVEIIGFKNGMANRIIYYCEPKYPFFDGKPVTASMEYGSFVGVAGSVSIQMLAKGEITQKGAFQVETSDVSAEKMFKEYQKRGFKFTKRVSFKT
ncbi:MAG: hypothetical protein DRI01_07565 [Chloroflexi bacterium]|nr:MAG: hypothetical protein DRI01_07565 [Chloroflexota bacterium]